jgi:DNA processing protein
MKRVIDRADTEWPNQLDHLARIGRVPERLFVSGDPIPRREDCLAIVGTRRASAAGMSTARTFARRFAEAGYTVVSGMARGIDTAAHRGALEAHGKTIAVVGCGLDLCYPPRNAELKNQIEMNGSLVSEYEDGTEPYKSHFPERNRIIAGLSQGVVVIEGGERSGALITARIALDIDRRVFAVPGSPHDPRAIGPNNLLRAMEATLATHPDHVFEDIAPEIAWAEPYVLQRAKKVTLNEEELEVLAALGAVPTTADQMRRTVERPPGRIALALSKLEVRGLARRASGGYVLSEAGGRALAIALGN